MTTTPLPVSPTAPSRTAKPELLAPAGDFEAMRAAVANGADAVYFGLSNFNARHRATNFSLESLPEVIDYLHAHNVRGYVTFNTLIFSGELAEAANFVRAVAAAGADAVIVQDLGLARLIGRLAPGLHVHGSTQMTLTEPLGIEFVRSLGIQRVILARELSATDIRKISAATDMPVEIFIHGALCVSYSGQCLTSEAIGGRSANRGQCAQACRLPYDLIVDGQRRDLGEKAYLLSPQDLAAYDIIDELTRAGVCSLKIEGRLKSAHYVAATTQTYRAAIDALEDAAPFTLPRERALELAQSFSRGFSHGFLDGVNHQRLVHARFPKSRGVRVGRVVKVTDRAVTVELEAAGESRRGPNGFAVDAQIKPGDGIVFDEGHPEQDEQGGRVTAVRLMAPSGGAPGERSSRAALPHGNRHQHPQQKKAFKPGAGPSPRREIRFAELSFDRFGVNLSAVSVGAIVWKTDDPAVRKRLESSFARETVANRAPIDAQVSAVVGQKLAIRVRSENGHEVTVTWDQPLAAAQKFPLTETLFREQFGRLGDSPFELRNVIGLEQGVSAMVPKSVLNELRRDVVAQLIALREDPSRRAIADPNALQTLRQQLLDRREGAAREASPEPTSPDRTSAAPRLHVLVRTLEQLRATLDWRSEQTGLRASSVYCDFEDIRKYKDAVPLARAAGVPIGLATVRIIKPGEEGLLRQVAACEPDLVLVRNLAGLSFYARHAPHLPLIADYSLNVANELTAGILLEQNVRRMTPSYDLNWSQMSEMLRHLPGRHFEAVIHQHMPMFHMEHCVFCHTLSSGTSYKDCGRPCDEHRVDLTDRAGVANPLIADVGCRNTVYNGVAQSGAEYVPKMREMGIADFRVEVLRESAQQTTAILDRYASVLAGLDDGRQAWRQLKVLQQLGVTRGTLGE